MYVSRAPGQKCQRCGNDNSSRNVGTKYCFACSKLVNLERAKMRRDYDAALEAKDKAMKIRKSMHEGPMFFCPSCTSVIPGERNNFCSHCGQRLDWSVLDE